MYLTIEIRWYTKASIYEHIFRCHVNCDRASRLRNSTIPLDSISIQIPSNSMASHTFHGSVKFHDFHQLPYVPSEFRQPFHFQRSISRLQIPSINSVNHSINNFHNPTCNRLDNRRANVVTNPS